MTKPDSEARSTAAAPTAPVRANASRVPAVPIVSTTRLLPPPSSPSPTPPLLAAAATPFALPAPAPATVR